MIEARQPDAVDVGKLNAILDAVRQGYRRRHFKIPSDLVPSRQDVEARPVDQRQDMYRPRLALRDEINCAIRCYRQRKGIDSLPWSKIGVRGNQIAKKIQSLRKLIGKVKGKEVEDDPAGTWWSEALSGFDASLSSIEAEVAELLDGPVVIRDTELSTLGWFVMRLAAVFKAHLKGDATVPVIKGSPDEYYGPFAAFVLAVANEAKIDIEPSTIHRILNKAATESRGMRKKQNTGP